MSLPWLHLISKETWVNFPLLPSVFKETRKRHLVGFVCLISFGVFLRETLRVLLSSRFSFHCYSRCLSALDGWYADNTTRRLQHVQLIRHWYVQTSHVWKIRIWQDYPIWKVKRSFPCFCFLRDRIWYFTAEFFHTKDKLL